MAGCIFQAQPAHHSDAVRPAIADRIAIEQQNKPTVKAWFRKKTFM
jgi:hypothetical protein